MSILNEDEKTMLKLALEDLNCSRGCPYENTEGYCGMHCKEVSKRLTGEGW